MTFQIPTGWQDILAEEMSQPYIPRLEAFVRAERQAYTVYPPEEDLFSALRVTAYARVRVVILGQDPYHEEGQAHGMSFSVRPGVPVPPSLVNIFKELRADLDYRVPNHGCLVPWAEQGVLLLNTVLTVRASQANSHKNRGWETFTDAVIRAVSRKDSRVVFLLWGAPAQKKIPLIENPSRHVILQAPHPSPLSAYRGFLGCRHFSQTNQALRETGQAEVDWRLQDI